MLLSFHYARRCLLLLMPEICLPASATYLQLVSIDVCPWLPLPQSCAWAAWYNTWLLIELTTKGIALSFLHFCAYSWGCTAVMGGLMTRTVISAQLSDPLMPIQLRANFGHRFEEGEVVRSVALQQHWLLRRLYMYLWTSGAMRKYNVLLEQAEFQVRPRCTHKCMTSDAAVICLS